MSRYAYALLHRLLPKRLITEIAGHVARGDAGLPVDRLIRWFVDKYGVDMDEAVDPDLASYKNFNDFFTRPLKAGARHFADADFVSPVDGAISNVGAIDDFHIIQAKGHRFTVTDLLGGDSGLAANFQHGSFANLYLSPRDYHRVHMPCTGTLNRMTYVPGALFSVNPATARAIPGLFARNERVVCVFDSAEHGPFAMVLVGATIVGSMATVWHGVVNPRRTGLPYTWTYEDRSITLNKGEEMGRFLLGSTVIVLFKESTISFNETWGPERPVRLGECMGNRVRDGGA